MSHSRPLCLQFVFLQLKIVNQCWIKWPMTGFEPWSYEATTLSPVSLLLPNSFITLLTQMIIFMCKSFYFAYPKAQLRQVIEITLIRKIITNSFFELIPSYFSCPCCMISFDTYCTIIYPIFATNRTNTVQLLSFFKYEPVLGLFCLFSFFSHYNSN